MLIGPALDEALALEGVEAVDDRLIGGNLTTGLDFSDEGSATVLADVVLDKLEHRPLFLGQGMLRQTGLRRSDKKRHKRG